MDDSKIVACGDESKVNTYRANENNTIQESLGVKINDGWLLTSRIYEDGSVATGSLSGVVKIRTNVGTYVTKLGTAVSDIEFKPKIAPFLTVAVASLGKGVFIIDAKNMKLKD